MQWREVEFATLLIVCWRLEIHWILLLILRVSMTFKPLQGLIYRRDEILLLLLWLLCLLLFLLLLPRGRAGWRWRVLVRLQVLLLGKCRDAIFVFRSKFALYIGIALGLGLDKGRISFGSYSCNEAVQFVVHGVTQRSMVMFRAGFMHISRPIPDC